MVHKGKKNFWAQMPRAAAELDGKGGWMGRERGGVGGQLSARPYIIFEGAEKTLKCPNTPHSYGFR